jgi:putative DNA primase/helicase
LSSFQSHKDQVLDRLSFENFYRGELENLKATAENNYTTLCPFHADNNPSLSVNFETGLFKCFGCGVQGDVFAFYMERHGVDFKEALAELGRRAGVEDKPPCDFKDLNVKEFALAKKLPLPYLEGQGVGDASFYGFARAVGFPYFKKPDRKKYDYFRFRFAGKAPNKFRTRKGDKVNFYGLWRLEEITAAGWCLIVEGETDALTCWLHNLPALGIPGKENWHKAWANLGNSPLKKILKEIPVWLWEEPDAGVRPPNQPRALLLRERVAQNLPGVKIIKAPADCKDISEAHCRGDDIPVLLQQLKRRARPPEAPPVVMTDFSLSDLGNARRLVAQHGEDLHYCHLSKKWYCWNGKYWEVDNSGEVERRAKSTVAEIYGEAAKSNNLDERKALAGHALRSESRDKILSMIRLAQSEPGIPVAPGELDSNPFLLTCLNGTIDLKDGNLLAHHRYDLITCLAPVNYDPTAAYDLWEKFLYRIMDVYERPASAERMVNFLQRSLGYSLTGSCEEECLFILWGGGANGKSTLVNTVSHVLGDYARNTPVETLLLKKGAGEIPSDVARLDGPRFLTAAEVDRGRRLAESLVKELTGRDIVTARFLYAEHFDFTPQFKLWLSTNNKPVIKGTDDAIWRRIMFVEFPVQIPKEQRDKHLRDKLQEEEGAGILNWMVQGCLSWQRDGLDVPEEVVAATADYRAEMDDLAGFLADKCLVGPGLKASAQDLYSAYISYCEDQKLREKEIMKQQNFGRCLAERNFKRDRGTAGRRLWRGIGLRSPIIEGS